MLASRTPPTIEVNPLKLINHDNLRDLNSFLGLGEHQQKPYTFPRSKGELTRRFQRNVIYFVANYAVVIFLVTMINALACPQFLFILVLLGGGWYYCDKLATEEAGSSGPTYIFGVPTTAEQRNGIMAIVSIILSAIYGGPVLMYSAATSAFICVSHACLRNAQLPSDEELVSLLHLKPETPYGTTYGKEHGYMVV
ncbi:hypothetical protein LEN26_019621 [Aphanomyces euteiches]|nr:hypothetical protein LEN26_019621 [Aphanomyces euteiches]KAH9108815.1 hypothetical protein AeMF1_016030 [Aphanomyces euteiches]KAH9195798.1 hypothetical protein AeNC1_002220 [Aphanomyces euteiches]